MAVDQADNCYRDGKLVSLALAPFPYAVGPSGFSESYHFRRFICHAIFLAFDMSSGNLSGASSGFSFWRIFRHTLGGMSVDILCG